MKIIIYLKSFNIEYYTLYYDRRELDSPVYEFSKRNIKTLFNQYEYPIFKKLLDTLYFDLSGKIIQIILDCNPDMINFF